MTREELIAKWAPDDGREREAFEANVDSVLASERAAAAEEMRERCAREAEHFARLPGDPIACRIRSLTPPTKPETKCNRCDARGVVPDPTDSCGLIGCPSCGGTGLRREG